MDIPLGEQLPQVPFATIISSLPSPSISANVGEYTLQS